MTMKPFSREASKPGPRTYFEKVWADHQIAAIDEATALLAVDRLFVHELTGAVAFERLEAAGRTPLDPRRVFTVIDHEIETTPGRGPDQATTASGRERIAITRRAAHRYGLQFFDVGDDRQGIAHVVAAELGVAQPGMTLVCGDSHTCTLGGLGALAWGVGSTETEHVLATQTLVQTKPKTMRVRLNGRPARAVSPKDLALKLIGQIGAHGGVGCAVEFAGSVVSALSVEGRMTLCNMAVEFSAKYGFVPPDQATYDYLRGREYAPRGAAWDLAMAHWQGLRTDPGARFDHEFVLECDGLTPLVTWGTSPEHIVALDDRVPDPGRLPTARAREHGYQALAYMALEPGLPVNQISIDVAYIGACTNGRLSDLRDAAAVLRGRRLAPGVIGICVPGSMTVKRAAEAEGLDRVFKDAGFEWHEAGCGLCGHMGNERLANQRVVSSTNRNFQDRQGSRTRTHLASPATVAASAVAGRLVSASSVGV